MQSITLEENKYSKQEKETIYKYLKERGITDKTIISKLISKECRKVTAYPEEYRVKRAFSIATDNEIQQLLASISTIQFGSSIKKFNKNYSLPQRTRPNRSSKTYKAKRKRRKSVKK